MKVKDHTEWERNAQWRHNPHKWETFLEQWTMIMYSTSEELLPIQSFCLLLFLYVFVLWLFSEINSNSIDCILFSGHSWVRVCIESSAEAAAETFQPTDSSGSYTNTGNTGRRRCVRRQGR